MRTNTKSARSRRAIRHRTSPVNWDFLNKRKPSSRSTKYYIGVIKRNSTPALFQKRGTSRVYVGGIYVKSAKGRKLPQSRIVYLDCSAPTKPIMHVAETVEDENRVRSNYSWSWVNFVFTETGKPRLGKRVRTFQIYSAGMVGTCGLYREQGEEQAFFKPLPGGSSVKDTFPVFKIEDSQEANHITDEEGKLGLYVDRQDNWKVKMTKETSWWDKFTITKFISSGSF